jgi:hypothetical protein
LFTTSVPLAGVAGGVLPTARRIITPAKSASPGFTQVTVRLDAVAPVTVTVLTGPGGVVSAAADVVPLPVAPVA